MKDEEIKFKRLSQAIEEDMTGNELFEIARERRYRINDLQKENAEQKAQIEKLSNDNHVLKTSFIMQQEQIEKMKCCGNCSFFKVDYDERYCEYDATSTKVCKNYSEWELAEW